MIILLKIFLILVFIEILLRLYVKFLRKRFQWIITSKDNFPDFNLAALRKFHQSSFDSTLGWVRKPNTSGIDKLDSGESKYNIDSLGSRKWTGNESKKSNFTVYGDSYAFARQVDDDCTWVAYLSKDLNLNGSNFGVGNYGFDQALIRYKLNDHPSETKYSIIAVVPETICRIHSYWKHYLEFGNTFAFKPKFFIKNNNLELLNNPIHTLDDYSKLNKFISHIQLNDPFYKIRFLKFQYRGLYILSLFRSPSIILEKFLLLITLPFTFLLKKISLSYPKIIDYPFSIIHKSNIKLASKFYRDKKYNQLFLLLLKEFRDVANKKKHLPSVVIIPQYHDVVFYRKNISYHSDFFSTIDFIDVIDLTPAFAKLDNLENYYTNDVYGGHLSTLGNRFVSNVIRKHFEKRQYE